MAISRLYIDGDTWEVSGNIEDDFLGYKNDVTSSRSGAIYAKTENKVRKVSVDEVMASPDEVVQIIKWLESCKAMSEKFTSTVSIGEDCGSGSREITYNNCLLIGEPKYNIFENKIDGFEFAYETRTEK